MCTPSVCAYLVHRKLTMSFTIATDVQKPRTFVFHHAQIINVKNRHQVLCQGFRKNSMMIQTGSMKGEPQMLLISLNEIASLIEDNSILQALQYIAMSAKGLSLSHRTNELRMLFLDKEKSLGVSTRWGKLAGQVYEGSKIKS